MKKMFLITALLSISLSGCAGHKHLATEKPVITGVETQVVNKASEPEFFELPATVKTKTSSAVSSMIMGRVTSVNVKEGDRVSKGQLLLTIDSRDTAQKAVGARAGVNEALKALEAAEQNKNLANKTFDRYKNLYNEKVLSKQEYDIIATKKNIANIEYERAFQGTERAKAGLNEVGVYQSYAYVTSPISGVVTQKSIDLGTTAVPGQPLLVIEDPSGLEVEASINESLKDKIKAGMNVFLQADDKTVESHITSVIPKIDPVTRTFDVKIALQGLTSGQYVKVKIPLGEKQAVMIPQTSIVTKGLLTGVYTVDENNIISYRPVKAGRVFGENVEILSGLNEGEKIIISGMDKAVDGGVVK